jgi:DNA-binding CsgD family transcriptional regulator
MFNSAINIAVVEPSFIISEGLCNLLLKHNNKFCIFKYSTVENFELSADFDSLNIVILNPSFLVNRSDLVIKRKSLKQIKWVGLVYSYFDKSVSSIFDALIEIGDKPEEISNAISQLIVKSNDKDELTVNEPLSEREIGVLVEMVAGLSNKEIADKLNISIHTVMSHRKNIIQKTGIKSLSGLTIYAISNKIVSFK